MATKGEFIAMMAVLYLAYPAFKKAHAGGMSTDDVYWQLLQDVPDDLLLTAAREHSTTCKWFPTIAELREIARNVACGAGLSKPAMSAEEAYDAVGRYLANPDVEDEPPAPAMRALRFVGGFWEWRHSERPGLLRKDFMDAYRAFQATAQAQENLLPSTKELQRRLSIHRAQEEAERLLVEGAQREAQALIEGSGREGHIQDG